MEEFRFGWWTTGRDQAAVNLFNVVWKAVQSGKIKGDFSYIFISRQKGEGEFSDKIIELSEERNIPIISISAIKFLPELRKRDRDKWRRLYHEKVFDNIESYGSLLAVLAGYMWVLSPQICDKISAINLHPALPNGPTGTWQEVIWKLLKDDANETGAMMHLVTPILDRGPAITYFKFPIRGLDWDELWKEFYTLKEKKGFEYVKDKVGEELKLFKKIRYEGEIRELPLIVQTLCSFSTGQLKVGKGAIFDKYGSPLNTPLDLTRQVEMELRDFNEY